MKYIFNELNELESSIDYSTVDQFVNALINCKGKIVGLGAGRMGYSLRSFIMRLSHLGFPAYMIGDTSVPRTGPDDLIIVNSSSGSTKSIITLVQTAKDYNSKIMLLCSDRHSCLAKLSDYCIFYKPLESSQIMKTAYEQFSLLLLDHIAKEILENSNLKLEEVENNHSILE